MTEELGVTTLDLAELVLQFRLMKALGYRSLFDPEFQKEIRNPFRRVLYYRIMSADSLLGQHSNYELLKTQADRISFFTDPELYRKVREREEQAELGDEDIYRERAAAKQRELDAVQAQRREMSPEELQQAVKLMEQAR